MMTPVNSQELSDIFFLTGTVYGLKNIFSDPGIAGIAISSLDMVHKDGKMYLYSYVAMASNLYAIIKPRFRVVEEVLEEIELRSTEQILKQLRTEEGSHFYTFLSVHRNQKHQQSIWQGIHGIRIKTKDSLMQKMDFIHNAPLDKQWQLVRDRADYRFSSACYYDRGDKTLIPIIDARSLV